MHIIPSINNQDHIICNVKEIFTNTSAIITPDNQASVAHTFASVRCSMTLVLAVKTRTVVSI